MADREPDGFNIGINEDEAGGQTVPHLHIHLIPRYSGDVADPAGGVRGVIPHRQSYSPRTREPVRDHDPESVSLPHLWDLLLDRKGRLRFLTGDYFDATEPRALRQILDLAQIAHGRVYLRVFQAAQQAFHPKAYLFHAREDAHGVALVGSSNLSRAGLATGVEWNYRVVTGRDRRGFAHVLDVFERLFQHPSTVPLEAAWIDAGAERSTSRRW